MTPIDATLLRAIAPRFSGQNGERQTAIIDSIGPILAETLARYEIDTPLRIAHFLAQICHESAGFRTTEEFASGSAYEGRRDLGNTEPGDGQRYKGRGLIQLTGRANYARFGVNLGVDLIADPALAAEPRLSLLIACEYWKLRNINPACDADDIETVTRRINGGLNGIDDRSAILAKAKAALGLPETGESQGRRAIRPGDKSGDVFTVQTRLLAAGFDCVADGDFGPGTQAAVMEFQARQGLLADGIVGLLTWSALEALASRESISAA